MKNQQKRRSEMKENKLFCLFIYDEFRNQQFQQVYRTKTRKLKLTRTKTRKKGELRQPT